MVSQILPQRITSHDAKEKDIEPEEREFRMQDRSSPSNPFCAESLILSLLLPTTSQRQD